MNLTDTFDSPREAQITQSYGHWPSGVPVFVKSLHLIGVGWIAAVALLWIAIGDREAEGASALINMLIPVLGIEALAFYIDHWTKTVGGSPFAHTHEWERALAWASVPIAFLIGTAFLMMGG